MLHCQNSGVPLSVSRCCVCGDIVKCRRFYLWHKEHKLEYEKFIKKQVEKYPNKYELVGGIMATKTQPRKILVIDKNTNAVKKILKADEVKKLTATQAKAYTDCYLIETSGKSYELVLMVKQRTWDGKMNGLNQGKK